MAVGAISPALKAPSTTSDDDEKQELQRTTSQAVDEGHDADIPSSAGYILDDKGEQKRRRSLASRRASCASRSQAHRDLEQGQEAEAEEEDDANVVWWDDPNDPENPYNWPAWKKVLNCGLISAMTFISPLGSSIFAPGVPEVMREFHSGSLTMASFVVSVYLLGFAAGPLLVAPLSEIYGRVIVYNICNVGFIAFAVGSALAPTLDALIVIRFFCGTFACAAVTNGGGTIADMVAQEHRGKAMAAYSIGPLLGPIVGPIAGGFITEAAGWRWAFWLLAIAAGVLAIPMAAALQESYAPVILERKVARLRKETGNDLLRSKLDIGLSPADYFKRGIIRPLKMLFKSPIINITSLYMAISYGYLYLMFTTMTTVFQDTYGFSTGTVGLAYLGLGVGSLLGILYTSISSDRVVRKEAAQSESGHAAPEYRLPALPLGAFLIPVGLFIYGWTAKYKVHWIVPILSHVPIGIGNLMVFMSIQMYLVDAFSIYAASAIAVNTVVRSIAGALLPMAGLPMFDTLGLGWGNSLLGFLALATVPAAFALIKWGGFLRKKFELKDL